MLKIAIIVFREVLEIALVISILISATKGVVGRKKWIVGGVVLGVFGATLLAIFTDNISQSFQGSGQELFNGLVLLASAAMISWTVLWMKKYGKKISDNLKQFGLEVIKGDKSLISLMMVVFFSVLREGSEIVLFSYGYFVTGDDIFSLILGGFIGLGCGLAVGLALYFGLIRVLGRHFFSVTSWILVFLAAGMVSESIAFLSNGGFISEIIYPLWDTTAFISEETILGKILNVLLGYVAKPSAAQLIGYLLTLSLLIIGLNFDAVKIYFQKKNI